MCTSLGQMMDHHLLLYRFDVASEKEDALGTHDEAVRCTAYSAAMGATVALSSFLCFGQGTLVLTLLGSGTC